MEKNRNIILISVWILVVLSFVTTQLTNDFFVFWAYGRFVSNSEASGISSLIETWEMKGLLFKAYLYVEYALTSKFSTDFSFWGQAIYKIVGLTAYLLILAISVYILPIQYLQNKVNKKEAFCLGGIFLLAVHFCSHFQAEMWGVLILLLSFALYLRDNLLSKVTAAFIYSLTFYLKSPIPLLGGSLFLGYMLLTKRSFKRLIIDCIPFVITTVATLFMTLFLIYHYLPQEFYDIWNASQFQHTLFNPDKSLVMSLAHWVYGFFKSFLYHPINAIGFFVTCVLTRGWIKSGSWNKISAIAGIWFFPLFYILLSNCFFAYHYYLLTYSSIIILLVSLNTDLCLPKKKSFSYEIIYIVFYIIVLSSISPTNISEKINFTKVWEDNKEKQNHYFVGCKLGEEDIMYLDDGTGAFLFSNSSYLRYFYPLPLQRITAKDKFSKTTQYKKIKEKALSYKGEYITLSDWFKHGNNDDIIKKIHKEYDLYDEIVIPKYSWNLFTWISPNSPEAISKISLYKKK